MAGNSFGARAGLDVGDRSLEVFRLDALGSVGDVGRLPYSLKVLLENLLRNEDGVTVTADDIEALAALGPGGGRATGRSPSRPARVLMQDFTGVPAVVDLAAMRDAMADLGGDPARINPLHPGRAGHRPLGDRSTSSAGPTPSTATPSWSSSATGSATSSCAGASRRSTTSGSCRPDTGICHQVNLEYLARVVFADADGAAYPDTLVGTDSHTPMVNGLGVLGWGVGGIEAEAAMLGQPISHAHPAGRRVQARRRAARGPTATDLVLTVDRAAAPPRRGRQVRRVLRPRRGRRAAREPGDHRQHVARVRLDHARSSRSTTRPCATCGSPAARTSRSRWSRPTPRSRGCGTTRTRRARLLRDRRARPGHRGAVSIAGPARPQDRVAAAPRPGARFRWPLAAARRQPERPVPHGEPRRGLGRVVPGQRPAGVDAGTAPTATPDRRAGADGRAPTTHRPAGRPGAGRPGRRHRASTLDHGHVVIAAITSCTNTSNPSVMVAAGLLAKKAVERGPDQPSRG